MKDSTIKLLFAGAVTMGGLAGDMTVIVSGIISDLSIVDIVALSSIPNAALIAGMAFFFGHSNGGRAANGK